MGKVINLGNEDNPTFEQLQERINSERKELQKRADNNADILKVLFDNQNSRVLNHKEIEMVLPIEKLEMVIENLTDLKEWIEMYDTIEDFLYQ
ncbi:hypothetical protein P7H75_05705 [Vagococcus carniphilus]|uniref:hypothetical protein n=1 Tax=Vagococcus carniphilus TaxID=218144 RepID=UPI00288EDC29|nr:hypothetical protein [Vagococcus carniphilus]MDT2814334.1 hypothetical protein [Vagococcus carniphilus]